MKIKTFIERPVLSIVISVAIILVGVIALFTLPIEQFPSIAPPTVEVTTSYPGANAETVQKSVIVPLEEAINGVENMTYINSTASNAGDVYITIYFKQGTDPDMAAVNVQNRVSKAQGQLPADVTRIGGAGPSSGMIIAQLTDWSERTDEGKSGIKAVLERINAIAADMPDVQIFAMAPPLIDGYGVANGFEIYLQDRAGGSVDELYNVGRKFIDELQKRPEIGSAYTTFNVNFPQFLVEVDAAKCQRAGTTADAVLATLAGYYSGQYVSNFNRFNKLYRVMIQSSPEYRITPESLDKIYTRMGDGKMAPLSQFVTLTKVYGPESLGRFNLYSAMGINGEAAQGYSSGDAIKAIQEVAASSLPRGYGFEFSGLSREESQTTNNTAIIFIVCTVFVYLILCGLYESFFVPFAVILSVPFGLMGSFLFAKLMGLENNIYLQAGLIMLIGLLSKTAILLTEYAADRRRAGMTLVQAALAAAKVRLRPILMTILAMIFGLLPLMFASGAGANGNSSLGSGVIGGMIFGTLAILFFVPVFFVLFQFIQEKVRPVEFLPYPDWEIRSEMESIDKRKKDKK
ncbi:MAG TPA: efflux RND transporter permease subunit [Candidatus Prevotella intestinigallinarum]|nr:efflux RND transporter permease subunit [Candidatus Prevotella intestinigallinarum]